MFLIRNPWINAGIIFVVLIVLFQLGREFFIVSAPTQAVVSEVSVETPSLETGSGTLTYNRIREYIDPAKMNLSVQIQYEAFSACDSTKTADSFSVETGDGNAYPADCKGVIQHVYLKPGLYAAQYLRNNVTIASTVIDITMPVSKSSEAPQTNPPVPAPVRPKEIPSGSEVYADFWKTASKGTTLEKYVWGASGDDDYYDGGPDTDTLEYFGTRAEYEIVRSPLSPAGANSFLLIRRVRDNSLDIVLNIEIFVFADQTVTAEDLFK